MIYKSLYLKCCRTGYEKYWMFMTLDDIIRLLKNRRIIDFWETHSIQRLKDTEDYDYDHICDINDLKHNYRIFAKQDINKIYELFCLLISISLDGDIDECMNSLDAIERKTMNKTQLEQWLNGDIQFTELDDTNKEKVILDYVTSRKCISDPAMLDYIHDIINLKEKK